MCCYPDTLFILESSQTLGPHSRKLSKPVNKVQGMKSVNLIPISHQLGSTKFRSTNPRDYKKHMENRMKLHPQENQKGQVKGI